MIGRTVLVTMCVAYAGGAVVEFWRGNWPLATYLAGAVILTAGIVWMDVAAQPCG